MATKFKSKYTAVEIENLLDAIGSSTQGAIVPVDQLPPASSANTTSFYLYDGKLYFVDNGEWQEVAAATDDDSNRDNEISTEDVEALSDLVLMFTDFTLQDDEVYFTLDPASFSYQTIIALKQTMEEKGQPYYIIRGLKAVGFLEDVVVEENGSECLYSEGACNGGYFYIHMTMIDGSEIKITEEENNTYLINYIGYVL